MNIPIDIRFPFSFLCFSVNSVLTSTYCFEVLLFIYCKHVKFSAILFNSPKTTD